MTRTRTTVVLERDGDGSEVTIIVPRTGERVTAKLLEQVRGPSDGASILTGDRPVVKGNLSGSATLGLGAALQGVAEVQAAQDTPPQAAASEVDGDQDPEPEG